MDICFRYSSPVESPLLSGQENKNKRKPVKGSEGEQLNERVGCSCYPRGDQPDGVLLRVVMESTAAKTLSQSESPDHVQRDDKTVHRYRTVCSFLLPRHDERTPASERPAQVIGQMPNTPSEMPPVLVFVKHDSTRSVHFRVQNTMLPNDSIFDLWNE